MSTKILEVGSVELKLLKSNPPQLLITAEGTVSTAGWENPELVLLEKAPENGIYEFDFCATPPSGQVPQVITSTDAFFVFKDIPQDLKGVKVNSSSNSIEQTTAKKDNVENTNPEFVPQLERIMGIEIKDGKLMIRVATGGCTTKESFKINVIKGFTGIPPYLVEIYRVIPDYCKAYIPEGVVLEYELKELGIEPFASFNLVNKIGQVLR